MKTSVVNWISIQDQKPKDLAYVLGAFKSDVADTILVFAMFYDADKELFRDADNVKRGANTKEPIVYWAPIPEFPQD